MSLKTKIILTNVLLYLAKYQLRSGYSISKTL